MKHARKSPRDRITSPLARRILRLLTVPPEKPMMPLEIAEFLVAPRNLVRNACSRMLRSGILERLDEGYVVAKETPCRDPN